MLSKAISAIRAILDLDPTISEEHREGIMQFAMNDSYTVANILREQGGDEVVNITKAAAMLGKSKPTIERYIKDGLCATSPPRCRVSGFSRLGGQPRLPAAKAPHGPTSCVLAGQGLSWGSIQAIRR